jgi:uncharacterized protein YecE (DUF72 family)
LGAAPATGQDSAPVTKAQPSLFALPPEVIAPAERDPAHDAIAASLPPLVKLGTMSWSFPGWRGLVYDANADAKRLSELGLTAYSRHPLLGAVEIDRSYYEPLPAEQYRAYAEQVPDDFRFVVKAHEECTVNRFPGHDRYGKKRGQTNSRFLDASYASEAVVGPAAEGLGEKLGVVVFQFPPQDAGSPAEFAARLGVFLSGLPKGVPCAVELRNPELLTDAYNEALIAAGALHCHNAWGSMPSVLAQARHVPPAARRPLVVRWLLRAGDDYEGAKSRFAPFSRLVEDDRLSREAIATLVSKALRHRVPALVVVNNKAEGCSPESVVRLAARVGELLAAAE